MIYSKTCEYAIRALSCFEAHGPAGAMSVEDVSRQTKVPKAYVAKIFQALVKSRILASRRGPGGGFSLRMPAKDLTVLRVMQALDDPAASPFVRCVMGLHECNDRNPCPLHEVWSAAKENILTCVSKCTVSDLAGLVDDFPSGTGKRTTLSKKMRHVFTPPKGA